MISAKFCLPLQGFSLDVALDIPSSGVTAIFGPSGSGKTTLLRCLAGLVKPAKGSIILDDKIWQDEAIFLPTHERAVGYVFQESSLFPHLDVAGNLRYAEKRAAAETPLVSREQVLSLLGIEGLLNRKVNQLSGGERQRVAIARTLLSSPRLLLMDEPLASLDSARKKEIIPYLKNLKTAIDIPILYVSHAADEVAQLADHIVVLEEGKVAASGPLTEMMSRLDFPVSIGDDAGAVLDVEIVAKEPEWQMERVMFSGGELWLRDSGLDIGEEHRVRILARDVSLSRARHEDTSIQNILPVTVTEISENADIGSALVQLNSGGHFLLSRITLRSLSRLQIKQGDLVWAQIKSVALLQ